MESSSPVCELCSGPASVHCASDDAFLCSHCDAHVHSANFLVASHVRQLLCSLSNALSSGDDRQFQPLCADDDSISSFSSSASSGSSASSVSPARRCRSRGDVEGVFVNWGRKLGVDGNAVAASACMVTPTRVALAGAFWHGLKSCGMSTWRQLSRLEEVSGVPAKQILAVQTKMDLKEGWDES